MPELASACWDGFADLWFSSDASAPAVANALNAMANTLWFQRPWAGTPSPESLGHQPRPLAAPAACCCWCFGICVHFMPGLYTHTHRHLLHNIAVSGARVRVLATLNYVFDFSWQWAGTNLLSTTAKSKRWHHQHHNEMPGRPTAAAAATATATWAFCKVPTATRRGRDSYINTQCHPKSQRLNVCNCGTRIATPKETTNGVWERKDQLVAS